MKNKSTLLLLFSLLLAVLTAGAAWYWLQSQSGAKTEKVDTAPLWVARETIQAGIQITQKMLEEKQVKVSEVKPGFLNKSEDIIGKFTKDTIIQGEAFPKERLYEAGAELVPMKLQPGFRAFSITVTQYAAVADLVKPGDAVDIFVYLKEKGETEVSGFRPDIARLLLQEVDVLGIRKETDKNAKAPESTPELYAVTLSVTVRDIEKLILAEETGMLKLALRPVGDASRYASYGVMWEELMLDENLKMRTMNPEYEQETDLNRLNSTPAIAPATSSSTIEPAQPATPAEQSVAPVISKPQPAQAPSPGEDSYTLYTVKYGDTLYTISKDFFSGDAGYYDEIMKMNGLSNTLIRPGEELKIPVEGR